MFELNRQRLLEQLEGVSDAMLDYTPNAQQVETIGTLLDHIAAIDWSWVFEDIDGLEMDYPTWKYAFALRSWSEIEQRTGMGLQFYLDRIADERQKIMNRLRQFSDHDLLHEFSTDDGATTFTLEWLLFHLINHEAVHIGQISLLKRLSQLGQ